MKTLKGWLMLAALVVTCLTAAVADEQKTSQAFSGQVSQYSDTYNGFRLNIPSEFTLHEKGATTDWTGPILDGGAATIYINVVEMKGVPSKTLYDINLKSKKDDRAYTDVVPVKVRFGKTTVPAFRCKEATNRTGSPDEKAPDDPHRWHLFVFGNDRFYTCGFTGTYATFKAGRLQATYEKVLASLELIPVR